MITETIIDLMVKTILVYLIGIYLFGGLISSIGMFVYFKKRKTKHPGLVFIPYYKHFYFEKYMFGFSIARRTYNSMPGILCALHIGVVLSFLFWGLKPFVAMTMIYVAYRAYLFRGMLKHYDFKFIFSIIIIMSFGGAPFMFMYLAHSYVPEYDLGLPSTKITKTIKKRGKKQ